MRLLIAEDDHDIRRALVALLQKNNYTVDETDNRTDAYTLSLIHISEPTRQF